MQSGVPWGQSSGLWAHCRFHLMSVKLWTVHIGQWAHCRGHSRQRAWPRFRARRVTAIAKPPIPVIIIATRGALPIIAWAMAPVAAVTPMPVTVPALMALPIPCLQSLRLSAIAARTGAMERLPEVEVAACLTCPSQTAPCRGRRCAISPHLICSPGSISGRRTGDSGALRSCHFVCSPRAPLRGWGFGVGLWLRLWRGPPLWQRQGHPLGHPLARRLQGSAGGPGSVTRQWTGGRACKDLVLDVADHVAHPLLPPKMAQC